MNRRVALAALAGLCFSLGGCVLPTKEQVTTIPVPHQPGSALNVNAHNGSILVHSGQSSQVQITAKLRMTSDERLAGTTIAANRDASGTLTIAATPPSGSWYGNEGCSFDISLPDVRGVTLKSSNGRIEISGTSGNALLRTSNGSITIAGHNGPIDADTSNGRVEVVDANGPVKADTSNGSVKVRLASAAAGPVDIDTSNGSVTLELGSAFSGTISARTSNGSISGPEKTAGSPSCTIEKKGRGQATLRVGTSGPDSTIRTSNGSVRISFAP